MLDQPRGSTAGDAVAAAATRLRRHVLDLQPSPDALAEEFLRTVLHLQPARAALLVLPAWHGGVCLVDRVRGVRRDPSMSSPDGLMSMRGVRILPGYEETLALRLFDPDADIGFLPDSEMAMVHGLVYAHPRVAHLPMTWHGHLRASLLLGLEEHATRLDLLTLRDRLQPLFDCFLAEQRGQRLAATAPSARAAADEDRRLPAITHVLHEAVIGFDSDGRVWDLNDAAAQLLRTSRGDAAGSEVEAWLPPKPLRLFVQAAVEAGAEVPTSMYDRRAHVRRSDGTTFVADVCLTASPDGRHGLHMACLLDLTVADAAEHQAQHATQQFRNFADPAPVGILRADHHFECVYVNRRWAEIHRMEPSAALGMGWISAINVDDAEDVLDGLRQAMVRGADYATEFRTRSIEDRHSVVQLSARALGSADGDFDGFIATVHDVSEQRRATQELRALAERDLLTGVANRKAIEARLQQQRRRHDVAGLLYIDLDGFKAINDSYGHAVGDVILKEVATRLLDQVREQDLVGRIGGDEFVVLLGGLHDAAAAGRIAEAVRSTLAQPFHAGDVVLHTSASVGIALDTSGGSPRDLLSRADAAMYQAKAAGKNAVEFYTPSLHEVLDQRTRLLADVHRALERDEFDVGYHAIMRTEQPDLLAIEALLRWDHPAIGPVRPQDCIPLLERTGLIRDVGRQVLTRACAQLARWQADGLVAPDVRMSVNVSPQQLRRQGALDDLTAALSDSGLPLENLMVELTESTLLDTLDIGSNVLRALHDEGVWIAVDDFGTGFSSLAYLKRFPVDALKIDRDFVAGMGRSEADRSIVEAICALGRSLSLMVIAEGVTDPDTLTTIRELGCQAYQGHVLGPAVRAASFASWLAGEDGGAEPVTRGSTDD